MQSFNMKIVHICFSDPYVDGWGYQSNLLPCYLQQMGVDNYVIASAIHFPSYMKSDDVEIIKIKGSQYEIDGIKIYRIQTKKFSSSLIAPIGLMDVLKKIQPDAIFHHNFNCTSLPIAARYAKCHHIPMVVDNHADTINMTKHKSWIWFYYKFLVTLTCKLCRNQIYKAYGVTHSRCDFIHDYYGLTRDKIDFLPIGADVDLADTIRSISDLRSRYSYQESDFLVVSGGKMGKEKGTDNLIRAVGELQAIYPQLKLVLFGKFEDYDTETQANNSCITTVYGWCDRMKTLELLKMADVACWPIHHTTLIEDAVSVCTPLINRKTGTTEHLIEGNGIWIEKGTKDEIKNALIQILDQSIEQKKTMQSACKKMRDTVSYRTVAKKLLNDIGNFK